MLVDSHCHLDFDAFDADRDAVFSRAEAAGVGAMVTICTHLSRFDRVTSLAESRPNLFCSVGIHPHQVAEEERTTPAHLIAMAQHGKVVGIGETGLDYYYDRSPREDQKSSFRAHIHAARETGLPLIVHTRDADDDMAAILTEEMAAGTFTGVLHCFSSGRALAETALALGLYISLSGIITFRNAEELRGIARDVPLDRLLVETDAPYLAPVPMRGKRNEPSFVTYTAEAVSVLKDLEPAVLATATTGNFQRLFARAKLSAVA